MNAPEDFTCQQLVELVTEYLEDTLPSAERARFEEHVADCEGCANYLQQMRMTIAAVGALRHEDIEPAARDRLLGAFRAFTRAGSRG